MDRVLASEAKGRWFESTRARQKQKMKTKFIALKLFFISGIAFAAINPMSPELIKARIQPVGQVNVAKPATAIKAEQAAIKPAKTGQSIYETTCAICHSTGVAGAPKFGDASAWQPHIAKGMNILFEHVKNGFNAMPPKGTCVDCTDEELKDAMNYMVNHSK